LGTPLRVLILEDREADAELMLHELRQNGFEPEWQRVDTEPEYCAALETIPDLVLADFNLPEYDGIRALEDLKKRGQDIPFVLVSGMIGEEFAVDAMKRGAADYVLKDRLFRLGQVVIRALNDHHIRQENRQAHEALRASESGYRMLAENMTDTVWLMDMDLHLLYISPSFFRLRGFTLDELNAIPIDQQMTPDSYQRAMALFAETLSPENFNRPDPRLSASIELEYYRRDGSKFWNEDTFTIILSADGQPVNILGTGRDITARKKTESALLASEASLREAQVLGRIGNWLYDVDQKTIQWSDEVYQLYERDPAIGPLSMEEEASYYSTDQAKILQEYAHRALENGDSFEYELEARLPSGRTVQFFAKMRPIKDQNGHVIQLFGTVQDITKEKQIEDKLRKSEARFRSLFEQAAVGVTQVESLSGRYEMINQKFCDLLGYTEEEIQHLTFQDITHPDDHAADQYFMAELIAGRIREYSLEKRIIRKDSSLAWINVTVSPMWAPGEQPGYHIAIVRDITQRKQAEQKLIESEAKYRTLFENIPDGVYRSTPDGKILEANPALVHLFGYDTEAELKKLDIADFYVDPNDRLSFIKQVQQNHEVQNMEIRSKHKDGHQIMVLNNARFIDNQGDPFFEGTLTDITALKNTQAELQTRVEETSALCETSQLLGKRLELPVLHKVIVEQAALLLKVKSGFLYLLDKAHTDLELIIETTGLEPTGTRLEMGEGLAGRVAQTLQPMILDDYHVWEGRCQMASGMDIFAILEVPLIYGGELIGVLGVQEIGSKIRKFTEGDQHLLSLFATQAASSVYDTRLFDETCNRAAQLGLLYDAGLALNSKLDEREQLEYLFRIAMDTLNAERVEFYRVDKDKNRITFEVGVGYQTENLNKLKDLSFPIDEEGGSIGWVVKNRLPLNIPDLKADSRYIEIDADLRSGVWVPVEHEKQLQGILGVLSTQVDGFKPEHERLLLLFANQAAVAMENARLVMETRRQLSQLNALREIDLVIAGSVDLRISLQTILEQTTRQLSMDAATILLLNPNSQFLEYASGIGFRTNALQHTRIRMGEGLAGQAALERKLIHISDLQNRPNGLLRSPNFSAEGFMTYYAAPLIARGQLKGVLEIFHRAEHDPDQNWHDFFDSLTNQAAIALDSTELYNRLQTANVGLTVAYDATLEGWARALELRDQDTEGHTRRVADLTIELARALGVEEANLIHIYRGSLLHDIGKMGVPDRIVLKPGPLTDDEWVVMRKHPQYAYDMLVPISFLSQAMDIPYCHHEKWDGSGYPRGLKGDLIPLAARIFSVLDVYDALTSDRPYRTAWSREDALEHIRTSSGTHFDPQVVECFLKEIRLDA
jgi:PAS domain S-box-containing protein